MKHEYLVNNLTIFQILQLHVNKKKKKKSFVAVLIGVGSWVWNADHRHTHLYRQDVYVETDEPPGDHQGPHDVMVHHDLPYWRDFYLHQLP